MPPADVDDKPDRRGLLSAMTIALGAVGVGGVGWILIRSSDTTTDATATSNVLRISLSTVPRGHQSIVHWDGQPVIVAHRSEADVAILTARGSSDGRSPYRSQRPDVFVAIAYCTYLPTPVEHNESGFICPSCGSRYDLAGRHLTGPASRNLAIPPYHFEDADTLVIGVDPLGGAVS